MWVRGTFTPSLLASLAVAQGERETQRETERETAPSTSPLTYILSVAFFHSSFFHLLFLLYQQLHNCDVMTKASVIKSQTGQDETTLEDRQTGEREIEKRRQ